MKLAKKAKSYFLTDFLPSCPSSSSCILMIDSDSSTAVPDALPTCSHSQADVVEKQHQTSDTVITKSVRKATTPEFVGNGMEWNI